MSSSPRPGDRLFNLFQRIMGRDKEQQTNQNQSTPEDMTTTQESGPIRRSIGCRLQVVAILEGSGNREDIDLGAVEDALENSDNVDRSFNIRQRDARINGDAELLLVTRGSIISEDQLENAIAVARNELLNQPVDFTIFEWRIESI